MRALRFATQVAAAALLFGVLPKSQIQAAENIGSASYMLPACKNSITTNVADNGDKKDNGFNRGYCVGVITGLIKSSMEICEPAGATPGLSVQVVVSYIERRPELMQEAFINLAHEALIAAWPCPKR
jgi:hypothetical protein